MKKLFKKRLIAEPQTLQRAGTALFLLVLAAIITHSMVSLDELGQKLFYGDMSIFSYILSWGAHAITHSPASYYDPPIFYPERDMLPGTDGLELVALVLSPLWLMFHNPVLMGNAALFLSHLFCLVAAYVAARSIFCLPRPYCILLAAFFAVSTDRFWHALGHVNLVYSGILPLIFLGVWKSLESPTKRNLAILAISLGLSVYLSVYFFVLGGLTAVIAVCLWLIYRMKFPNRFALLGLMAAVFIAGIIASPKALVYRAAAERNTQTRSALAQPSYYSATIEGYTQPSPPGNHYVSHWYDILPKVEIQPPTEDDQFLGYFLLLLVLIESLRLLCKFLKKSLDGWDRLSIAAILVSSALIICSFGPTYKLSIPFTEKGNFVSPYRLLYYAYLQYSGFYRAPARLAFIVQWTILLPIAVLFVRISPLVPRLERGIFLIAAVAIIIFENVPAERPAQYTPTRHELLALLDKLDPTKRQPYALLSSQMEVGVEQCGMTDWRPTVNGWAGSPLGSNFDQRLMHFLDFPTTATLAWMAQNHVPWVIVPDPAMIQKANADSRLSVVAKKQGATLYKIKNPDLLLTLSRAELDRRREELRDLRASAPGSLTWPSSSTLVLISGDGASQIPNELPTFKTLEKNSISVIYDLAQSIPPGLYDQIEIEYELLEGESTHNTKIYWRSDIEQMGEKRAMEGTEIAEGVANRRWKTIFDLHENISWMQDNILPRVRFDFYDFNSLEPVTLKITEIKFKRFDETPELPLL